VAAGQEPVSFGELLRWMRVRADLTQEELAHAAGVSPRSVSDLERGVNHTARKDTAHLLADALNLEGPEREKFAAVARGRVIAGGQADASRPARESKRAGKQRRPPLGPCPGM
jgi:transcriptional regulator with XRE-family HTH domain